MTKRTHCCWLTRVFYRFLVAGFVLLIALLQFPSSASAASPDRYLVRLHFKDRSQLQTWVDNGLDVWEVHGTTALVSLGNGQRLALEAEGFSLSDVNLSARASFPACYRTYDDMLLFLHERESRYPQLLHSFDIGDSWEKQNGLADRDLYVVQLTNLENSQPKPKLFLVAEHHAREIITPEIAMDFIDDLLVNYGQDPTITWLLDNREIWVMPMANPDGYARAAQAEDWRKNANRSERCPDGSPPWSYGVDLNRNYGYQWGLDAGSSPEPCNLTYRGEAPFSEPETQAIRDLVRQQDFDILVSLHSYGRLVLYPWAHTWEPAPDAADLNALATRMAKAVGYIAEQSTGIGYMSSGDTTDWSYGELGIPSFTIEVGGGSFWPACSLKDQIYQELRPALIYAAMAADHPYEVAGGPDVRQIAVDVSEPRIAVRARISDQWTGGNAIEAAELFIETLGEPGTGIALSPSDGDCNTENEWMTTHLDDNVFMQYAGQRVPLFVVAQDATGTRGVPAIAWLDLREYMVPQSQDVTLWATDTGEPAFEIRGGYVYEGSAHNGHILMTVRDTRIYRGAGTLGELLYTLHGNQVQAGEAGPVIYTLRGNEIYDGPAANGHPIFRIENDRLTEVTGSTSEVVFTANVDLAGGTAGNAALLLPILADRRY